MCNWPGGLNELANYVEPQRTYPNPGTAKNYPSNGRGYARDEKHYKYIGKVETSLLDTGTLTWLCLRCGAVVAHQNLHDESMHK